MKKNNISNISTPEINYTKSIDPNPKTNNYVLHNHKDSLEIHYFLKVDAEFRVEGSVYELSPNDTIIASNNEMHRIIHHSNAEYERIVVNIKTDFFVKNNCNEYSELFFDRQLGENNLVPSSVTESTNLQNAFLRLDEYYNENPNSPVINAIIIEILHILHKTYTKSNIKPSSNKYIRDIITYINNNLTSDITLESICEQFYINKSYLCRIFKKHTGYTLNKYITHKRIMLVRELCSKNMSITDASIEAGFGNYSNFYKMYIKETGHSPKIELKK